MKNWNIIGIGLTAIGAVSTERDRQQAAGGDDSEGGSEGYPKPSKVSK